MQRLIGLFSYWSDWIPNLYDPSRPLFIDTDASLIGVGACLREAYGLYWTLNKARDLIEANSTPATVVVDQRALHSPGHTVR
jgi:hypothetical protein